MYQRMIRNVFVAGACIAAALSFGVMSADAGTILLTSGIPMSELNNTGEFLEVGDKIFGNFDYNSTGNMPDEDNVNVIPIQDADGNYGFRLQGAFGDLPGDPPGSDALLTYTVWVADDFPHRVIVDAHLSANLDIFDGDGFARFLDLPRRRLDRHWQRHCGRHSRERIRGRAD